MEEDLRMMLPRQHRHWFARIVPRFPVGVLEMGLLMSAVLEGYSTIHETNPKAVMINDAKYVNMRE